MISRVNKIKTIKINFSYNRYMFKRGGNIANLKKSGDLISATDTKIIIKTEEYKPYEANLNSLDLANKFKQQQEYTIENISNSTTTITIKDINKGIVYPMTVNRNLAFYGKIGRDWAVTFSKTEDIFKDNVTFLKHKNEVLEAAAAALKLKQIEVNQYVVIAKRINALNLSYVHATIGDIANWRKPVLNEDKEQITIVYHVITTKPTNVDYGGPNQFKPIFLYYDVNTNISYYTIPLTYMLTLRKEEYTNYFLSKNKEAFKNDTIEVQNQLAWSIKKVVQLNKFKLLNVNQKCINITLSDIEPNESFPDSIYNEDFTDFVPEIPFLID